MQQIWLMYLRKSRQDDPNETVEEVLSKHETILQEWAQRELGYTIPAKNIYREVVSGESIDERSEIKAVLSRIEDPEVAGVIVIEPSRLSRGDLADCARIIDSFRFTHSLIVTPMMTYDLEKKMERKFFQDELLRGNDYLEYTKEILYRGRVASIKRGCYINSNPPYGYNRIKIGRDWTLEPNENADNVRLIFHWYVNEGISAGSCARRLNEMGVPAPKGGEWERFTILTLLGNIHYAGKVRFSERGMVTLLEDGERVKKMRKRPDEEIIIAEGKQPAIVDRELFERAQVKRNDPRNKHSKELVNPLAGIIRCQKCGRILQRREKSNSVPRLECPSSPRCSKTAKEKEVIAALIAVLENSDLPLLEEKVRNGDGDALKIQKRRLAELNKHLQELRIREDKQYEFLETGFYSQERFNRQNATLRAEMEKCENQIFETRASMPENINYEEKLSDLKKAIELLKEENTPVKECNRILRKVIETVDYTSTDGGHGVTHIHLKTKLKF